MRIRRIVCWKDRKWSKGKPVLRHKTKGTKPHPLSLLRQKRIRERNHLSKTGTWPELPNCKVVAILNWQRSQTRPTQAERKWKWRHSSAMTLSRAQTSRRRSQANRIWQRKRKPRRLTEHEARKNRVCNRGPFHHWTRSKEPMTSPKQIQRPIYTLHAICSSLSSRRQLMKRTTWMMKADSMNCSIKLCI